MEETLKCNKCNEIKNIDRFRHRILYNKPYIEKTCKSCLSQQNKEWLKRNPDKIKEALLKRREYRKNNLEKVREQDRNYYNKNKNTKKKLENRKKLYQKNREKNLERARKYREKNRNTILEKKRIYWQKVYKFKYKNNPEYKIRRNIRKRLHEFIQGKIHTKTEEIVGMPLSEFKIYIASLFEPWMSWDNYGFYTWHIDHIIPLSSFDLTDPEQIKKANHYTNLRPLSAKENISKHNKIIDIPEK